MKKLTVLFAIAAALPLVALAQGRGAAAAPAWAPAPRVPDNPAYGKNAGKPDFGGKGMWGVPYVTNMHQTTGGVEYAQEPPFTPKAAELFKHRQDTLSKEDPEGMCLPPGVPRMMYTPYPAEILQLQDRVVFIFEGGAHVWRNIWLDGRKHSDDPNPTYLGESVGHWEGDTLVVDVIGFNERTWLDFAGHPHGEKLHVTERYTRPSLNVLHYEVTIEDPEYYTKPWTVTQNIPWRANQELLEYICQENNRDLQHLVGQ